MKLLYELSFEHLKVEMPEGDLVIIVSKCSKMKLFATGDSEFHIVGVISRSWKSNGLVVELADLTDLLQCVLLRFFALCYMVYHHILIMKILTIKLDIFI